MLYVDFDMYVLSDYGRNTKNVSHLYSDKNDLCKIHCPLHHGGESATRLLKR